MKGGYTLGIVVCFVIILVFTKVYKSIKDKNAVIQWPPYISKCPEYWVVDKDNPGICKAKSDINLKKSAGSDTTVTGYDGGDITDFRKSAMSGNSFRHWDGVSNFVLDDL